MECILVLFKFLTASVSGEYFNEYQDSYLQIKVIAGRGLQTSRKYNLRIDRGAGLRNGFIKPDATEFNLQQQHTPLDRGSARDLGIVKFAEWNPLHSYFYDPGMLSFFPAHKSLPVQINISNITLGAHFYPRDEIVVSLPGIR